MTAQHESQSGEPLAPSDEDLVDTPETSAKRTLPPAPGPTLLASIAHETGVSTYLAVANAIKPLPGLDDAQRQLLTRRIASTAVRRWLVTWFDHRALIAFMVTAAAVTALFAIAPAAGIPANLINAQRESLALIGAALIGAASITWMRLPKLDHILACPRLSSVPIQITAFALAVIALSGAVDQIVDVYLDVRHLGLDTRQIYTVPILVFGLAILSGYAAAESWRRNRYGGTSEPLDAVFLQVFTIVIRLQALSIRRRWTEKGNLLEINRRLERAARIAERALRGQAPLTDIATRREAATTGAQLAAVIRLHKHHLASSIDARRLTTVQASLVAGLLAWCERDLDALIAAAPPITLSSRLTAAARRIYPALLLATASIALPIIPSLSPFENQIHVTLGVLALVSLLTGGVSPASSIADLLGKSG